MLIKYSKKPSLLLVFPRNISVRYASVKIKRVSKKKGDEDIDQPLLLGRVGNNLKGGIVGLANVGKSTFFQAITRSNLGNVSIPLHDQINLVRCGIWSNSLLQPANYPFATIDPEEAKVIVPSLRFDKLCEIYQPKSKEPATLSIFDIAGLTRGASKGDGLGNAFLSHIRAVDGLYQVVRAFQDPEIIHIEGNVNPVRDLEIIRDELVLKDMEFVIKGIELATKAQRGGDPSVIKAKKEEIAAAEKVLKWLEDGKRVANGDWSNSEIPIINSMTLLTAKPSVYIVNVSEEDYILGADDEGIAWMKEIKEWVDLNSPGDKIVPISIGLEARLAGMDVEVMNLELKELDTKSALPEAIQELRKCLHLISYFTCGKGEVREWTIRKGTKAPQAAGIIHKDLEKTFILANVTKYKDVITLNGDDASIKSSGKILQKGKDYIVEDGDVIHFRSAAGKK